MTKKILLKLFGFGILTWLIPFLASFPFYSQEKGLIVDIFLFKTIMIIISALIGTFLLVLYFKDIKKDFVKNGFIVGAVWLAMNWILDLVILVPMAQMDTNAYFMGVGLRYLVIPIYSIGMGLVIKK